MDSEHRHELAENDLARILMGWGQKLSSYRAPIIAGIVAIVALLLGSEVMKANSASATKQAWERLSSASVAENFGAVADDYPGQEVAAWAKVNEGRSYLNEGIRDAFTDKESSTMALTSAKEAYTAALDSPAAPPEVRERALYGLAVYEETVSDGDTAPAIAAYQRLIDEFPEASARKYAESRIVALESEQGKAFYAWFSKQEPKREAPTSPLDTGSSDFPIPPPPSIEKDSSEETTAGGDGATKEPATTEKPAESPDETTKEEAAKPESDANKAAEAPATEEATASEAAPEVPAAEKPADE